MICVGGYHEHTDGVQCIGEHYCCGRPLNALIISPTQIMIAPQCTDDIPPPPPPNASNNPNAMHTRFKNTSLMLRRKDEDVVVPFK